MRTVRHILVAALTFFGATGCEAEKRERKLVVATTGMIADLVERVSGGKVEVMQLMQAGVDPHLYKAKESAIRRLFQADLVFYNGLHLEGKMDRLLKNNPKAVAVARDILAHAEDLLLEDEGQHDPHIWFDVSLWARALDVVEAELIKLDPSHAELYRRNAAEYRSELKALHEEVKRDLASIPQSQRVLVTAHDAFRYFGRAYEIEVYGLQGVSTASQAGLREVQEVVNLVVSRNIKALFVESSVPPDGVNAIVARCRDRNHRVSVPDDTLFSDAMGDPGTPEGTYPGMVRHNVRLIVDALK